jgi:hypothetical protein
MVWPLLRITAEAFHPSLGKIMMKIRLRLLVFSQAKECLTRAISEDSLSLYSEALQLAEQALRHDPRDPEMHFILGIAKLRAWGDRDYAWSKQRLLMGLGTQEAMEFAKKLQKEISSAGG